MQMWRVTNNVDGSGDPVLIAGSTDNGMVSVWTPDMVWVTPEVAARMSAALANAANATMRGKS